LFHKEVFLKESNYAVASRSFEFMKHKKTISRDGFYKRIINYWLA